MFSRPIRHTGTTYVPTTIQRAPSPIFLPPVPHVMREPGKNWFTIITADDPIVIGK